MELVEEKAIARGMVRVQSGEDLMDVLRALAAAAGWVEAHVTGSGVLDMVELKGTGPTATFEQAAIVSLSGRVVRRSEGVDIALFAMVLADDKVEAGRIEGAMTGGLTLVVDAVVAPSASKAAGTEPRPATSRAVSSPAAAKPSAPGRSAPGGSPPGAPRPSAPSLPKKNLPNKPLAPPPARRLVPNEDEEEEHENPIVDNGDVLVHPQLGRLTVVGDDTSGGIKVRIDGGKIKILRLDALEISNDVEEDEEGNRTFKVIGPRRKRQRF